ncbi:MAG: hypothetical protein EBY32_07450 [Proteobacteria bacterium]|jgi:hypothetical protein|nr:hypothetical protein [Pseudomonadota bacterium]
MEKLAAFVNHLKTNHPSVKFPRPSEELYIHIQTVLLPHALKVVQKDNGLFTGPAAVQILPEVDIRVVWDSSEEAWKKLHLVMVYSFMQGNPKEKIGKIVEALQGMLPGGSAKNEIMEILGKDETESSINELFELVMNTRLATIVGDLVTGIQLDDLGIDFDDPDELLRSIQHPEQSELVQTIVKRAQVLLEERVKSGRINQAELVREIEMLRAKFQSSFGKYLNEMVVGAGGNTTGTTGRDLVSNSPEARRARMLARLQRKQREKGRK